MRENILSFPCDAGTQAVIEALQKRFTARAPREPVSRSSAIRWLIQKGGECVFNSAEFKALMSKGHPVKWGGRPLKKKRGGKARRAK